MVRAKAAAWELWTTKPSATKLWCGLDGEVEGLLLARVLDGGDAVPEDVVAGPLHRHLAAGPEVVELAVALGRQEGVVAGGDDGAAAVAGDAVGGVDAVAVNATDVPRLEAPVRAGAEHGGDGGRQQGARAPRVEVVDLGELGEGGGAAADGVVDPRRARQAAAEAELGEAGDGAEDLAAELLVDARLLGQDRAQEVVAQRLHRGA